MIIIIIEIRVRRKKSTNFYPLRLLLLRLNSCWKKRYQNNAPTHSTIKRWKITKKPTLFWRWEKLGERSRQENDLLTIQKCNLELLKVIESCSEIVSASVSEFLTFCVDVDCLEREVFFILKLKSELFSKCNFLRGLC